MDKEPVQIRSDDIEDILGRTPGWITRNGIIMFSVVVLLLITGAWVFKIPDVKKARITLTSAQPPADLEARAFGKIEQLFVSDNDFVEAGSILAEIENSADLSDIQNLKKSITGVKLTQENLPELHLPVNGDTDFGSIQDVYAVFNKYYREYAKFISLNYHQRKIDLLEKEDSLYAMHSSQLDERSLILREELSLALRQYERDSSLFRQGVVSESDFENSKASMLQKRNNWQEIRSLKSENDIMIAGIRDRILELELRQQEEQTNRFTLLEEGFNNLKAAIAQWEKQFLLIAPVDGYVTFNSIWSENQNVRVGDKVMTIVPGDSGDLLGKINLPLRGAGEVREGQQVNIRFENYPYLEYGMVRGLVSNVSKVPQDEFYTVEVELPDGLVTYYELEIEFHQHMQGNAEIITDNMRLLQRIFNPVRSAVTRQREM